MKTNRDKLAQIGVMTEIAQPRSNSPYRIGADGYARPLPGTGGITYNFQIGDLCTGIVVDHVEPGVTSRLEDAAKNGGINFLACVGNEAWLTSGDAKGARGYVTGKHGGAEHVMIWFKPEDLEKMAIGDKIMVKSWGVGLQIEELPGIFIKNLDPLLLEKMNLQIVDGVLQVPVATCVPAYLMGSGIGSATADRGDYDIMTADQDEYLKCGLDKLRFGDIVLLQDCDTSFGRGYLKGAVTIGVVIHSDCTLMGHGPGITTLFTAKTPLIKGLKDEKANIACYLGVK
ncbi:MAG: DUF4438 domain-containing protein [Symbiobacteriaceae bacterium]|nr:DUF4438 domain-containing protein [Symbiobacteriaceae bacterium]